MGRYGFALNMIYSTDLLARFRMMCHFA